MAKQDLAEFLIRKAKAEGLLEDFKSARHHTPPPVDGSAFLKAGYRIMADSGALPREIELKKAIAMEYEAMHNAENDEDREEHLRKLNDLQMILGVERDARRRFYMD
jgi:hypothetical protein